MCKFLKGLYANFYKIFSTIIGIMEQEFFFGFWPYNLLGQKNKKKITLVHASRKDHGQIL